ncbi:hypothetical protein HJC23_012750 [Cyclotella cryptica]|uniref:Sulfotransferase domain-containing protein n=1 Tax=Cyclotella cryptica TaxID=29204 RepID=A0ABD3Q3I9_9STRA
MRDRLGELGGSLGHHIDPPTHSKTLNTSRKSRHENNSHSSIELTAKRKRDLLASVGFLDEDEELPSIRLAGSLNGSTRLTERAEAYDKEETQRSRKKSQRLRQDRTRGMPGLDFDEQVVDFTSDDDGQENDELLDQDNKEEYDEFYREENQPPSSSRGVLFNIATKLVWVLAAVATFIYVFNDDPKTLVEDQDSSSQQHEPYSYMGYKDGRIPDDDVAQYGGGLLIQNSEIPNKKGGINDDEVDEAFIDEDAKDPFTKHQTGIPGEDFLWEDLDGFAELSKPYNPHEGDIYFFWHVPKCGGTTLQDLMMHCFGMIGANEVGGAYAAENGSLQIVQLENGNRYVNVDVTQPGGIQNAHDSGFGSSGLADVVMSSRFHDAVMLFTPDSVFPNVSKGRCFTLLRHPIKRAISMFYYLQDATWEHTYNDIFKSMTIEEYAVSQYAEDNWMVRFLTNEMTGTLDNRHLDLAKQILESKCLVGIMEEFPASIKRFDRYFGWSQRSFEGGPVQLNDRGICTARVMSAPDNAHEHPNYEEGSEIWNKLLEKNMFDLGLYNHAVHLFHNVQVTLIGGQPTKM